jgi:glycine/D-amino acid oxidase-like deaminating enzyme
MQNTFWTNDEYIPKVDLKTYCAQNSENNFTTEILIVGGGITGVMLSYMLSKEGKKVVLCESKTIGMGATGHSAGMLVSEFEGTTTEELIKQYGQAKTDIYWQAHNKALRLVETIIVDHKIDCEFSKSNLYIVSSNKAQKNEIIIDGQLRKKLKQSSQELSNKEIDREIGTSKYNYGLNTGYGLGLNPLKLVQNISTKAVNFGAVILENSHIYSIDKIKKIALCHSIPIHFEKVIIATDAYDSDNKIDKFKTSIAITKELSTQELASICLEDRDMIIEYGIAAYHYLRVTSDNRILIGYGDIELKTIDTNHTIDNKHLENINQYIQKLYPNLNLPIEYAWSGCYGLTRNTIPYFEYDNNSIKVLGAGLQITCIAMAQYIADKIMGRPNKLDLLYKI